MYLRRVEAHGFKSFADRQVFEFGPGITAVVGPNGSGKSNVSDALRWALGEQSARAIRARRSEDFIFSGSDTRNPQGMAEVTLSLDNSEHWMPIDDENPAMGFQHCTRNRKPSIEVLYPAEHAVRGKDVIE